MIRVEIRLFAHLRQGRDKKGIMEFKEGTTLSEIIRTLGIDEEEVSMLLLNGIDGPASRQPKDGDIISLFPPVGGG